MPSPEALQRYSTAKDYVEAIKMILDSQHYKGQHVGVAIRPTHLLAGFALELYLKAWLIHAGMPVTDVEKLSHNLQQIFDAAVAHGLPKDDHVAHHVNFLHEAHGGKPADPTKKKTFLYRYTADTDTLPVLNWSGALLMFKWLDITVDTFVGASASFGLKPGH